MKATTLLTRQHRRIQQLLAALEFERHLRQPLLVELIEELMTHFSVAERAFYPGVDAARLPTLELEALRGARECAKEVLLGLASSPGGDPLFASGVSELRALFERHVVVEERLLAAVDRSMDERALERLGLRMDSLAAALLSACRTAPRKTKDTATLAASTAD